MKQPQYLSSFVDNFIISVKTEISFLEGEGFSLGYHRAGIQQRLFVESGGDKSADGQEGEGGVRVLRDLQPLRQRLDSRDKFWRGEVQTVERVV